MILPCQDILPSRAISPRRNICLFAFTPEELPQIAYEQRACVPIAPCHSFCAAAGVLELYTQWRF